MKQKKLNGFAQSEEGFEIGVLHVLGSPIAPSQTEMTFPQRLFLLYVIPIVYNHMKQKQLYDNQSDINSLKYEVKRRNEQR